MTRIAGLFLLGAVLLAAACASKTAIPKTIPSADLDWRRMDPARILERLASDREKLPGLSAAFVLTMDDPPPGQFSYLTGLMFVGKSPDGQPALRIKALGPMGNVYFDMVLRDGKVGVYVPMRETLYQGQARAMEQVGMGKLFAWMLFDPSAARIPPGASLEIGGAEVVLPLETGRLSLDKRTGLPVAMAGQDVLVRFEKYVALPGGFPPAPTRILVTDGQGGGRAVCALSQVTPGLPPAAVFDLFGYAPKRVEPLESLAGRRR